MIPLFSTLAQIVQVYVQNLQCTHTIQAREEEKKNTLCMVKGLFVCI